MPESWCRKKINRIFRICHTTGDKAQWQWRNETWHQNIYFFSQTRSCQRNPNHAAMKQSALVLKRTERPSDSLWGEHIPPQNIRSLMLGRRVQRNLGSSPTVPSCCCKILRKSTETICSHASNILCYKTRCFIVEHLRNDNVHPRSPTRRQAFTRQSCNSSCTISRMLQRSLIPGTILKLTVKGWHSCWKTTTFLWTQK